MTYVDGFVLNVKKSRLGEYRKMASEAARVWKDHGALQYFECRANDLDSAKKNGCLSFKELSKPKADEIVFFSFIIYKSKSHRNSVNKKVMAYFQKKYGEEHDAKEMPFDMKKMAYGGFEAIVKA